MAQELVIIGAGGNCFDIVDIVRRINAKQETNRFDCLGFLDDDPCKADAEYDGLGVLGGLDKIIDFPQSQFVFGIGSPNNFRKRHLILEALKLSEDRFPSLIDPAAVVSPTAKIGFGTVIFSNVTIASNVKLGSYVIVLPNCTVNHDSSIGDYCCLATGVSVSGNVKVGSSCYLGTNCSIKGEIDIGAHTMIGMGAVVLHSVLDQSACVGNPARRL